MRSGLKVSILADKNPKSGKLGQLGEVEYGALIGEMFGVESAKSCYPDSQTQQNFLE